MCLLWFVKPGMLPTAETLGCQNTRSKRPTKQQEVCRKSNKQAKRKRKRKYTFSPEDRAVIGKYAAENGNAKLSISIALEKAPLDCSRQSTSLPYVLKNMGIENQSPR